MRLSKRLYVGTYVASLLSFVVGPILQGTIFDEAKIAHSPNAALLVTLDVIMGASMTVLMFAAIILWLVLFYKAWQAIQDGHARTTPGKAIGYLFIPFYMAYWIFQCIWGFAKDYNAYIERHGIQTKRLSEGFFLANAIVRIFWAVPFLFALAIPVTLILNIPMMSMMCTAVNALPAQPTADSLMPAVETA